MIHRGETVAPGIAVGPVHLRGFDDEIAQQRVAADQVEEELNRRSNMTSSPCRQKIGEVAR